MTHRWLVDMAATEPSRLTSIVLYPGLHIASDIHHHPDKIKPLPCEAGDRPYSLSALPPIYFKDQQVFDSHFAMAPVILLHCGLGRDRIIFCTAWIKAMTK